MLEVCVQVPSEQSDEHGHADPGADPEAEPKEFLGVVWDVLAEPDEFGVGPPEEVVRGVDGLAGCEGQRPWRRSRRGGEVMSTAPVCLWIQRRWFWRRGVVGDEHFRCLSNGGVSVAEGRCGEWTSEVSIGVDRV